ncbi:hypothetical protein LCGC14_0017340 [marine sediment metagenome]|uniref:Peptidase M56 domain-containing protein n=1 Tax=marine sediment metagenome TaxID=412755 RepID=A0A0F9YG96_9ZZZZ|nr:hypothetical protein [Phycisphaerae bacterium]HDZ42439.1 hypothetical protein [Phycisphaerae bacterium]
MTGILGFVVPTGVTGDWLLMLLDASVKGLAILAIAGAVTLLMRKASAAERQLVWVVALAGILVLPIVSIALPRWQVLPNWRQAESAATMSQSSRPEPVSDVFMQPPVERTSDVPLAAASASQAAPKPSLQAPSEPQLPSAHDVPASAAEDVPVIAHTTPTVPAPTASVVPPPPSSSKAMAVQDAPISSETIMICVLLIWAVGVIVCLAPMVLGRASLWRLRRRAHTITDESWLASLRQAAEQLGVGRRVDLLRSDRCTMPMVWGVFRARLMLPGKTADWSADRCQVVLLHELAHVKRRDCLTRIITQLACGVYWFNPLVWLAGRRVTSEGERACDDLVLAAGNRPSAYAEHLVNVSSGLQASGLAVHSSIAMVRPARLEGRVRDILNPARIRRALKRRGILIAAILAVCVTVPLAIIGCRNPETSETQAEAATPDIHTDFYGDPLPQGTIARMGTRRLKEHGLRQVRLSPDESALMLVGTGGIKIADVQTGKTLARMPRGAKDARFSDDGNRVIIVRGKCVYSWQWRDTNVLVTLVDCSKYLARDYSPRITTAGGYAVIAKGDKMHLVNTATQTPWAEWRLDERKKTFFFCSDTGKWLAVVNGTELRLFNMITGKKFALADLASQSWLSMAFSRDDNTLAVSGRSPEGLITIRLWSLQTREELEPLPTDLSYQTLSLAFTPDGHLAHSRGGEFVDIWDIASRQKLREINIGRHVRDMAFTSDGRIGVFATNTKYDGTALIHNMADDQPVHTFQNHETPIRDMQFSADGERLFTLIGRNPVRMWQVKTGELLREIRVPVPERLGEVRPVLAVSPDGTNLAMAEGNQIVFRDQATGVKTGGYASQGTWIKSLAFSPDGQRLACLSINREAIDVGGGMLFHYNTITVRETDTGRELLRIPDLVLVDTCEFSGDGELLVGHSTRGIDKPLTVWSSTTGEPVWTAPAPVNAYTLSPDDQIIAVCESGWISLRDMASGEVIRTFLARDVPQAMAFSPDGLTLAVESSRNYRTEFCIYDVATGEIIHEEKRRHGGWVTALAFSPDGRCLVTGSTDGTALVWKLPEEAIAPRPVSTEMIPVRVVGPDGKGRGTMRTVGHSYYMFRGHPFNTFHLWDSRTWQHVRELGKQDPPMTPIAITPNDGHVILANSRREPLRVRSLPMALPDEAAGVSQDTDNFIKTEWQVDGRWRVHCVARDASWLIAGQAGTDDGFVMFDTRTGEEIRRFVGCPPWAPKSAAASADGEWLALGDESGKIRIWRVGTDEDPIVLSGHDHRAWPLRFSPDGDRLISGGADGTLRIWSTATGQLISTVQDDQKRIGHAAISPDCRYAVFADRTKSLRLYDLQTGREASFPRFDEIVHKVRSIDFSPDGRHVIYSDGRDVWRRRLPD